MLFSVEQAFVGRDEKRAPPKNACVGGIVQVWSMSAGYKQINEGLKKSETEKYFEQIITPFNFT